MSAKVLTLADYCYVNPAKWLPEEISHNDLVSFIPMSDVTESGHWNVKQVRSLNEVDNGFTNFRNNDVLVAKITPCFENGKGALVNQLSSNVGFGSTEFHILRAKSCSSPRFIFHISQWNHFRVAALKFMSGSAGQQRVSSEFFYNFELEEFTKYEQETISDILDSLDMQIRETEAIIAKLQQIKQGLLHDLLTRGVDENGELRPSFEDAPEMYKPSELGWIPKSWDCLPLGAMANVSYGISDAIDTTLTTGINTLTLPCVKPNGELVLQKELLAFTHPSKVSEDLILHKGDLLFNWRNGSQNHLGKTAYFDLDGTYTHVGFLLKVRAERQVCYPLFLYYALNFAKDTGVFLRAKIQVNNTFNSAELRALKLCLPREKEQIEIAQKVKSLSDKIAAEATTLNKLRKQKLGLMDDLLTGKVRVTELLNPKQAS